MDFRILGPLEVCEGERTVTLGGDKQRALLAILLLHANEVISADRLIDDLWGDQPPPTALRTLQAHVSRLRKALDETGDGSGGSSNGVLVTHGHGYLIHVGPGELDLDQFRGRVEEGRETLAAGDPDQAAGILRSALALWRGRPLGEFEYEAFAQPAIAQLEELRLGALEERIEADLALGRHRQLVSELGPVVEQNPLRERLRAQLMLALYRCGRQSEALEAYQAYRRALSEELGLDPGPGLQQLEVAILNRDPSLELQVDQEAAKQRAQRAPTSGRVARERPRLKLVVGAAALIVSAIAAAIVASSGGGAAAPTSIAPDAVGAISPAHGLIAGQALLGHSPSRLAAGAGSVWATSYDAGTVSRINPATRTVVQTIRVGSTPSGIAFGAGALWVANNFGNTVSRIDPRVDEVVQTIPVGNAPSGVAVGDGSVWVTNTSDGTLTRIDAVRGVVTKTIAVGGGVTDVAVGLGAVWVSDEAGARVLRIDPRSGQETAAINVGTGPGAITIDAGSVWVANSLDGTVSRIDPQTNTVAALVQVGEGPTAIDAGAGGLWVANEFAGSVSRIDPTTSTVARTINVGNRPQGVAIAAGFVWVGAQATHTSHRGGTLTVLSNTPFDSIDPAYIGTSLAAVWTTYMTHDGLTAFKRAGGSDGSNVVADLATTVPPPTDGGRTYTFQLRRDIRYSNGTPLRPEDFRRAIERGFSYYWGNIVGGAACTANPTRRCDLSAGIVADDTANTVTFHLVVPDPEFVKRLAYWGAVAVPAATPYADVGRHPLPSTGPYEIASYSPAKEVRLVRNPDFHEWSREARPDGYPDQIVFRIGASPSAEVTAVEQRRADFMLDDPPPARLGELQTRFKSQLHINPNDDTALIFLNTRVAPFNDINVRQALNYAIDRRKTAALIGEEATPTCQLLPPYIPGYKRYCPYTLDPTTAGVWRAHDLATAKALIAASHTRGMAITIWSQPSYLIDYTSVGRYLVSLLDQLGYRARIKAFAPNDSSFNRFADSRTKGQAAFYTAGSAYPAASEFIQFLFSCHTFVPNAGAGDSNPSEFCAPRLDATIREALAAEGANSPAAAQLWASADRQLTDHAPFVALGTPSQLDFVSQRVGNYQYNPVQELIDQMWIR
jgi:YVTN family beta-propeller protein